jgi:hypothetical protein
MPSSLSLSLPFVVEDPAVLQQVVRLRIIAWAADGELPSFAASTELWLDEHDSHAINWGIMCEGLQIAAVLLSVHKYVRDLPDLPSLSGYEHLLITPIAVFTRLVVSPGFRGRRLSKQLDRVRFATAQAAGCGSAVTVTHVPSRLLKLQPNGFKNLSESLHRTVSFSPSYVVSREIGGGQVAPGGIAE